MLMELRHSEPSDRWDIPFACTSSIAGGFAVREQCDGHAEAIDQRLEIICAHAGHGERPPQTRTSSEMVPTPLNVCAAPRDTELVDAQPSYG